MSELRVNKIVPKNGLPASASGGGVIQVVSVTKTDAESLTSTTTETLIPGMQATITPQSASNKILVMITLTAQTGASFASQYAVLRRNIKFIIFVGVMLLIIDLEQVLILGYRCTYDLDQASFGPGQVSMTHLDSPGLTSAVTYGLYHADTDGVNNALLINRSTTDSDSSTVW